MRRLTTLALLTAALSFAPAPRAHAQATFFEGFDDLSETPSGEDGPPELIGRGWIFRNQSAPQGPRSWFDGPTPEQQFGWPDPQAGEGYIAVDGLSTAFFGGRISNWAILPAVPGQQAGDVLQFYILNYDASTPPTLEVRYSPTGGDDTGSGANDVGDFTQVLIDLDPIPVSGWNLYSVALPGDGRIALRYYAAHACNFGCFGAFTGFDSLSIGEPPPPPCNLPPVPAQGETVVWTAADSPYQVCKNIGIPPGSTIIVEAGVEVNFDAERTLTVSGTLDIRGTPAAPVLLTAPNIFPPFITVQGGTLTADFADFGHQLRVADAATVLLRDCTFVSDGTNLRGGLLLSGELFETTPFVHLQRCVFTESLMILSDCATVLEDNTFTDSTAWLLRGYADVTAPNTFTVRPLVVTRETTIQPFYLDGVMGRDVPNTGGLSLEGGDFLLGPGTILQNNLYPLSVTGGLRPESAIPVSGNLNNAIAVGAGGFSIESTWPDFTIPYRLTSGVGGNLTIDPGVVVEGTPLNGFTYQSARLVADGLPDNPITFRAFPPGNRGGWQGFIFHVNSDSGPRLEHCTIEDARFGAISTDNWLYADNCVFRNNQTGANTNTFGVTSFRKTRFLDNTVGVSTTDLGTPILLSFTNPNSFEGNTAAVDAFEFGSGADANLVWWGHPTGPQHPQNPDGQGDPIIGPGASGISIFPFLTERPDFADTPPVVRMIEPNLRVGGGVDSLLETGAKYLLRWDAEDVNPGGSIVTQRILFSPDGHFEGRFEVLVDNIPGDVRTLEITVPDPGFAVTNSAQFLRIVAVDNTGQEAWDQVPLIVPSNRLTGQLTLINEEDFNGRTFFAGEQFPDLFWSGSVSGFPSFDPFILLEADGTAIGGVSIGSEGRGVFFADVPHISTDAARLALRARNNSNDQLWFFSDGYFSIRHDPRLGFVPPTVELLSPAPGASFPGGSTVPITWSAAATEGLYSFDLQASYDAGRTWHVLVESLPGTARSYAWRLPASDGIPDVRVRVIARGTRFQNSTDGHDRPFAITPGEGTPPCAADWNNDDAVNSDDYFAFLTDFFNSDADFNNDTVTNSDDYFAFLAAFFEGC